MTNRIKVSEPVWSSHAGRDNPLDDEARVEIEQAIRERRFYHITNEDHEPSDCYNCKKGVRGVCVMVKRGQPLPSLEWCNANYDMCQYWEPVHG